MKIYKKIIVPKADDQKLLIDILASNISLSKEKIKDVLNFGGVWLSLLHQKNKPRLRVRRSKKVMNVSDVIEFYFDEKIFNQMKNMQKENSDDLLLRDGPDFSCWYKPPFMLTQGNDFGDHGSLLRIVEQKKGETFLVHRIDREVSGIVIFAHNKKMAATLSEMFQKRSIDKYYLAKVEGVFDSKEINVEKEINSKIDGKEATTKYTVLHSDVEKKESYLLVKILTGRKHQIRRHMAELKHPIIGDYRYGRDLKESEKGQDVEISLWAFKIEFESPFDKRKKITVEIPLEQFIFEDAKKLIKG